jgi:molybdopterin-guanine dinucleotide biosynthesis protein A
MSCDKALLELGGRPVITRLADELSQLAGSTLIACGPCERREYSFLGLPQIADAYPGCGPLAGLHAALSHSRNEWNLVAACDLPFASAEFLQYILSRHAEVYPQGCGSEAPLRNDTGLLSLHAKAYPPGGEAVTRSGADAVVAVSGEGRVQPLLGLYHRRVLPVLEAALSSGNYRVMDCLETLNVLYVPESEFTAAPSAPSPLYNMNTPEDYDAAAVLAQHPAG